MMIDRQEISDQLFESSFLECSKVILKELTTYEFEALLKVALQDKYNKAKRNVKSLLLNKCTDSSSTIRLSFPGYKADFKYGKIVYDYRVDLVTDEYDTSLSHVNLLMDLYLKCEHGGLDPRKAIDFLMNFFIKGNINELDYSKLDYETFEIDNSILDEVSDFHTEIEKTFNRQGNFKLLTHEEFVKSLKIIAVQEDINYPIGRFQGRKMCLKRYIETLWLFCIDDTSRTLTEILQRTLKHGRPPEDWPELSEMTLKINQFIK